MVGARNIVAVDPVVFKQKSALDFGATHTAASMDEALPMVTELTRGQMADVVILAPSVMFGDLMDGALSLTGRAVPASSPVSHRRDRRKRSVNLFELAMFQKEVQGVVVRCRQPAIRHPQPLVAVQVGAAQARRDDHQDIPARADQPGLSGHARRREHPWRHHLRVSRWAYRPTRGRTCERRHRSARARRTLSIRPKWVSASSLDTAAGRGASGVHRASRLPAFLGRHQARRHHPYRLTAPDLLQRKRDHVRSWISAGSTRSSR